MTIKVFIFCIIFTQRTTPLQKIGLWTLRPRFSSGFTPICARDRFSNWSAVSPSKPRDFPLPEPTIPFFHWSAVSPSKPRDFPLPEPTIPFFHWSAVSHLKPRDFPLPEPTIVFSTGQRFPHPPPGQSTGSDVTGSSYGT